MQSAPQQTELDFSEPPAPTPAAKGPTNAYPTAAQLAAISEKPYTYDLRVSAFQKYWTSRTGYRSNSVLLIEQNATDLAAGGNYQCQWYQHIWNLWVAQPAALQVAA